MNYLHVDKKVSSKGTGKSSKNSKGSSENDYLISGKGKETFKLMTDRSLRKRKGSASDAQKNSESERVQLAKALEEQEVLNEVFDVFDILPTY